MTNKIFDKVKWGTTSITIPGEVQITGPVSREIELSELTMKQKTWLIFSQTQSIIQAN